MRKCEKRLTPTTPYLGPGLRMLRVKRAVIYIFYLWIQWLKPTIPLEWAVFIFRK